MENARSLLEKGYQHHQEGRLRKAEELYLRALQAEPDNPDGLSLLAVVVNESGRLQEAIELMEKAVRAAPGNREFSNNLGQLYKNDGQVDEAIEAYRAALTADPDFADAHNNLANALVMTERLEDAIGHYRHALEIDPNNIRAQYNLATTLSKQGNLPEAIEGFLSVVGIDPDYAEAYNNLGVALHGLERFEEAVDNYRKALTLMPDYAEAHNNLGVTLLKLERPEDAITSCQKALAVKPDYAEAHNNLGKAFRDIGRREDALANCQKALAIRPDYAEAHSNLGLTFQDLSRREDAIASYRKALAIKPDFADAHINLGMALLLQGDMEEGWSEYEWRHKDEEGAHRQFPQVPWNGEPVDAKTVLVWAEQGIGDEVMFAGIAPDLVKAGAKVILEADPRLVPLFERSFDGIECIAKQNPPGAKTRRDGIDFQTPGGNLGRWLRPDLESFPGRGSYLSADAELAQTLKDRYRDGTEDRLIGIAWISKNKRIGPQKSMALMELAALARIPGLRFIDLQYGDTADERAGFEDQIGASLIHDETVDQMADLDAFAAQIAAMDLIISVSNTTVHLAGALGVPAWVMLNFVPLPCWLLEGEDSPWYSSVRLFRQSEAGVWGDVIGRVEEALKALD